MVDGNNQALKVEIDNIKEDIKEIKEDQKETNKYYRDTIEVLKENQLQQTLILQNQERQFTDVNKDINNLNSDISGLRTDMNNRIETSTKWYQNFLDNNFGMVFKILIVLVLLLSGIKLVGIDIKSILGL